MIDGKYLTGDRVFFLDEIKQNDEGVALLEAYRQFEEKKKKQSGLLSFMIKIIDMSGFGGKKPSKSEVLKYKKSICNLIGNEYMDKDVHELNHLVLEKKKKVRDELEATEKELEERFLALYDSLGFKDIYSLSILSMKRVNWFSSKNAECIVAFGDKVFSVIAERMTYNKDCYSLSVIDLPFSPLNVFEKVKEGEEELFKKTKKSDEVEQKRLEDLINEFQKKLNS